MPTAAIATAIGRPSSIMPSIADEGDQDVGDVHAVLRRVGDAAAVPPSVLQVLQFLVDLVLGGARAELVVQQRGLAAQQQPGGAQRRRPGRPAQTPSARSARPVCGHHSGVAQGVCDTLL